MPGRGKARVRVPHAQLVRPSDALQRELELVHLVAFKHVVARLEFVLVRFALRVTASDENKHARTQCLGLNYVIRTICTNDYLVSVHNHKDTGVCPSAQDVACVHAAQPHGLLVKALRVCVVQLKRPLNLAVAFVRRKPADIRKSK